MAEDTISDLEKKVNENPKNAINWLALIEAQLSAGFEMRIVGNTFLEAVKANPAHDEIYFLALEALDGFDVDNIIAEIKDIRETEMNKPRGIL
jgi:hypothetical protein